MFVFQLRGCIEFLANIRKVSLDEKKIKNALRKKTKNNKKHPPQKKQNKTKQKKKKKKHDGEIVCLVSIFAEKIEEYLKAVE